MYCILGSLVSSRFNLFFCLIVPNVCHSVFVFFQTFGKRISCCSQPDCRRVDMRCSSDASFFRVCGRCKVARYCSRECQVAHWSAHKRECQTIDKTQSVRRKVRCLCQTLYASSNKLMAFAKKCKADTQRQFMDIQLDTLSENNTVDEMLCVAVWRRMVQLATTTMLSTVTALLTELREHEYQGVVVRVSHAMGSERVFLEFVAGPQKT